MTFPGISTGWSNEKMTFWYDTSARTLGTNARPKITPPIKSCSDLQKRMESILLVMVSFKTPPEPPRTRRHFRFFLLKDKKRRLPRFRLLGCEGRCVDYLLLQVPSGVSFLP